MAGEIQLGGVTLATESGGVVSLDADVGLPYASQSEVFGTHTTGSITSGTTSLTVASGTGISDGDYVTGEGIAPGTTVSSGGGTTSITLSANASATLSSDPVAFYKSNKVLSPGLVAGALCRAWVNFNGTGTVAIRASGNVSSITDNGTGDYTVNFTTAMPDAKYSLVGFCRINGNNLNNVSLSSATNLTNSTARIITNQGTLFDADYVNVAIFR